jgi:hypothetical protein
MEIKKEIEKQSTTESASTFKFPSETESLTAENPEN